MILGPGNLVHYLLDRGLLSTAVVVDGEVLVVRCHGRHQSFKVSGPGWAGYFVKQVRLWSPWEHTLLRREALVYQLAAEQGRYAAIQELLPRRRLYDSDLHLLVLELLPGAPTLAEHYNQLQEMPAQLGGALGTALGKIHEHLGGSLTVPSMAPYFRGDLPWVLDGEHPERTPPGSTPALAEVLRLLREDAEVAPAIQAAARRWEATGLIHGDMKWENCLVLSDTSEGDKAVKFIDWELADLGDPCWDVAGILQSFLTHWLTALSMPPEESPPRLGSEARASLERLRPAIRTFRESYLAVRVLPEQRIPELLERITIFTAARLLQTAFELVAPCHELTPYAVGMLRVARNLLKDPHGMEELLLGMPVQGGEGGTAP